MCKDLLYLSLLLILFSSCEEYYKPYIDPVGGQLVVEAFITNDPSRNFVHLTKTRGFYDRSSGELISGATVEFVEINGAVEKGQYTKGSGNFKFNTVPVIGKNYKLRISDGKDIYESETVTMPPLPSITDFYTGDITRKEYRTDAFGVPVAYEVTGRELYADAPITDKLSNYRFVLRAVLEWFYDPPSPPPPPPPLSATNPPRVYGWESIYPLGSQFNIAGPKIFSQSDKIEKHPLMTLSYDAQSLYLNPDSLQNGWIIIIDQYGTSKGSFDFHEKLNSQFTADGSLLDPVQAQVYGNITCATDSSKKVFGYFDLNSYRQSRYYLRFSGRNTTLIQRQINNLLFISEHGAISGIPPQWWEN
jgi:hypothetical protein